LKNQLIVVKPAAVIPGSALKPQPGDDVDRVKDQETIMQAQLRLASSNSNPTPGRKLSIAALHQLAERLIGQVRNGKACQAHDAITKAHLHPLGIAVVATWMYRAGLSEDQIIAIVV
jgi:hypothetical protein